MNKSLPFVDDALRRAGQMYQAGRLGDAESICRQILSSDPHHPGTLHLLGIILGRRGDLEGAIRLMTQAVAARPDFHAAHVTLAQLHASRGNLADAISSFQTAAQLRPGDATGWYSLGIVQRMSHDSDGAMASFQRVVSIQSAHAEAHFEIGALLRGKRRLEEAVAAFARAALLRPESAEYQSNFGSALMDAGQLDKAEAAYRRAMELDPKVAVHHVNLGDLLARRNDFDACISAYNSAIALAADCARAYSGRGSALAGAKRFDEALADHRRALQLAPNDAEANVAMSIALTGSGDIAAAELHSRCAIELNPNLPNAWQALGLALRAIGRLAEASAAFRKSLELNPSPAVFMLLSSTSLQADSLEAERLLTISRQENLSVEERIFAGFALGKMFDDADRFDEAFEQYRQANMLVKRSLAERGIRYDGADLHRRITANIATFSADFFSESSDWGDATDLPVFIVGMPRSGTTLVEQIAASHSKVFGAGELVDISSYAAELNIGTTADAPFVLDRTQIARVANAHKNKLMQLGGTAVRVIDKLPGNIWNLGFIATLFPKARVIFCRRDPRDNCLSCYFQRFAKESVPYTYDLVDCAQQYLEQERLFAHWQSALPLRMMTMQYEELVADLEGQSRRLIDFLGLDWEPRCLDFHKTDRPILTASVCQVRQPIYTRSVGRWKHYEKHLKPLIAALG